MHGTSKCHAASKSHAVPKSHTASKSHVASKCHGFYKSHGAPNSALSALWERQQYDNIQCEVNVAATTAAHLVAACTRGTKATMAPRQPWDQGNHGTKANPHQSSEDSNRIVHVSYFSTICSFPLIKTLVEILVPICCSRPWCPSPLTELPSHKVCSLPSVPPAAWTVCQRSRRDVL